MQVYIHARCWIQRIQSRFVALESKSSRENEI